MIRYLIKNNFKLMFRNPWSILVMLVGPLLVIVALSSAFSSLLQAYESADEFVAGYRLSGMWQEGDLPELLQSAGEETGIIFCEYPDGDVREVMEHNGLACFVEFTEDAYRVYKSGDYEAEGMVLEYFMDRMMDESVNAVLKPGETEQLTLPEEELPFMPAVDAKDYYGIIEIVYFTWCGLICATGVLSNEKKYGIANRFRVSGVSELGTYLGKLLPMTAVVAAGMAAATGISIVLYDVHWGTPLLSIGVMLGMILAANAFGLMLYSFTENLVFTVIILFSSVWIMGFLGGSFETYMYSNVAEEIKQLSPIYHCNRALVELSCMGTSEYVKSALLYSAALFVSCSGIAVAVGHIRKRGRA